MCIWGVVGSDPISLVELSGSTVAQLLLQGPDFLFMALKHGLESHHSFGGFLSTPLLGEKELVNEE